MGKAEKIVVLGVLFVIVLILAVSLQTGGGTGGDLDQVLAKGGGGAGVTLDDREGEPVSLERGSRAASEALPREPGELDLEGAAAPQPRIPGPGSLELEERLEVPQGAPALLNAGVRPRPIYEVPETIPEDWALLTLAALADHRFDPGLKVYTIRAGDSFESVSERYYGDEKYAQLLRRNNEGVKELEEGRQLLVPIHDDGLGNEQTYEVLDDDSLWKIAKKVYGKGHRWGEIWEANRDVLRSPDDVRPGTLLRIP